MSQPTEQERIMQLAQTCACINLRRATQAITNYYNDLFLAACGLRATQLTPLVVLYLAGPKTINEIAERLGLDRTTLTRNLKPLEEAGLLTITPGDDQRTRVITLTEHGIEVLLQALPAWESVQAHIVQGIGEEPFNTLLAQLSDIAALTDEE